MTLAEIRKQIPTEGKTCGMEAPLPGTPENWLDHALEKLACDHIREDNMFAAGLATAMEVMTISMTLSGVDWQVIQDALGAMENYTV